MWSVSDGSGSIVQVDDGHNMISDYDRHSTTSSVRAVSIFFDRFPVADALVVNIAERASSSCTPAYA